MYTCIQYIYIDIYIYTYTYCPYLIDVHIDVAVGNGMEDNGSGK